VIRTPIRHSEWLSSIAGGDVFLKLEIVQPTSSYKIRGAFNAALLVKELLAPGTALVTASAGNHGKALAHAAKALDLPLTVFVAADAPRTKIDAIRAAGARLELCASYDEAERAAKAHASTGALFISPYSHPDVIAGAGTIMLEILEDLPDVDTLIVPVGGGGLVSGIGIAARALSRATRVLGIEVAASSPFTKSLAAGRLVTIDVQPSLADGLTGNLDPDTITLDIVRTVVDRIAVVGEDDVKASLSNVVKREHLVVEGAAAVGPAAIASGQVDLHGRRAVVILTGANTDRVVAQFAD
jgi:threonine dehydratase